MDRKMAVCLGIAVCALLFALYCRYRAKKILSRLDQMLDQGINGSFVEEDFNESLLSAVETKFAHYLSASQVSAEYLKEEKNKIKTLIGDISHQTKTPLANILLYTQLLEEQDLSEESRTCVSALDSQARKLQSLIVSLMKTSRLETGVLSLCPGKNSVWPMLERAAEEFRLKAEAKGITLDLEKTEDTAVFDSKWTEEAVDNLLDNAIKYTAEGGNVSVRVVPYELFCRIDVADNGMGIPEEEQAKIFGRFYRSEKVRESEGVGIGLYLVRQIAAGQGGYVKVESRPGEGSVFSLFLPRN